MIALKGKREKKKHTLISVFRSPDHDFIVASYYCTANMACLSLNQWLPHEESLNHLSDNLFLLKSAQICPDGGASLWAH